MFQLLISLLARFNDEENFKLAIGRLCEKHDGHCVICDSLVKPCTMVRICDECNYGSYQGRCVICGGPGISDAYYCKECTILEKDVSFAICRKSDMGCDFNAMNLNLIIFISQFVAGWLPENC